MKRATERGKTASAVAGAQAGPPLLFGIKSDGNDSPAVGAQAAEQGEPVAVLYLEDAVLIDAVGEATVYKFVPGDEYAPTKPHVLLYTRPQPPLPQAEETNK